jgi:hypothetical protein
VETLHDPKCFDDKRQAHNAAAALKLEAKGKKVIHGDAAKKIFPDWDDFELREKVALRIAAEIIKKHTGALHGDELLYLVEREHEGWDATHDSLYDAFKLPHQGTKLSKLSEKDLVRFFVAGAVADGLASGYGGSIAKFAVATCKRMKIDPKKVRKEIQAEAKAAAAAKKTKAKK